MDLQGSLVEVYAGPQGGRYANVRRYGRDEQVRSESVPDLVLPVREVLG